jgi:ABC-type hemin transport system ATPase subunit
MPDPILIAENVTYQVGDITLVKNADLMGHPGEVIAVLGPKMQGVSPSTRSIRVQQCLLNLQGFDP